MTFRSGLRGIGCGGARDVIVEPAEEGVCGHERGERRRQFLCALASFHCASAVASAGAGAGARAGPGAGAVA